MRRKRMRLVSLILSAVCLLGCAVQPAPVSDSSESNTKVSAYAASQAEQNEEERTVAESLLPGRCRFSGCRLLFWRYIREQRRS